MDSEGAKATREELKNIMRFWLKTGCDGFRVDMAGSLVKNDDNGKGTIKALAERPEFLDREFPEAAMVSEWGEPDKSLEGGFHMDFLLHFGPSRYNDLFRCESRTLEQEAETFPSSLQSILKTTKKQTKADLSAYLPEITIWTDLRGISAETI